MIEVAEEAKRLFHQHFYEARAEYSDVPAQDIRAAGGRTKAEPNGEDELWWLRNGPSMVQRWIDWRQACGWEIWMAPDGRAAIELELFPTFGDVPVKMFIDRVFRIPETGQLVVVDLKSGRRTPNSDLQLAFYAAGIKCHFGIDVPHGAYWMARTGELSPVQPIDRFSLPLLTYWVKKFVAAKEHGIFLPHLTDMCRACGVNRYCYAYGGKKSSSDPDSDKALGLSF